jgi:hypothetical protein
MAFTNAGVFLLSYDSGANPATNQAAVVKRFVSADNTPEDQFFNLQVQLTQSGGATSPTAEILFEASLDGTTWFRVARWSTNGTTTEVLSTSSNVTAYPYARASLTVGGATAPVVVARVCVSWSGQCTASTVA